ncbi:LOW QUALITY PROTEIN: translation initiation factor IF-2-like [Penaeus monodon]|uniref:LOW QUALITY PROTEIN: translation initiation factor IF-2-like n=1 Tax=Penaeus monodon TaxID=6687 RepID=UPI0018A752DC|nr:LOW QUALITY PROTEIN: translation initiation factor IF-2-like [Penaeus monodon]
MDGDAEWVGVDFEFGQPGNAGPTTTARPRPRPRPPLPRPPHAGPATEPPHDANDVAPATPTGGFNATALAGSVGGLLGVVLLLLVVYMFVLRRKLNKAKLARGDSEYRLRVEDVAHLTHLDETSNTYVNTTDLQKLVSSVRAKKKAEEKLPLPPRSQQQAPPLVRKPTSPSVSARSSSSSAGQADNDAFRGDVDVVTLRPPMPLPHPKPDILQGVLPPRTGVHGSEPVSEIIYSNVQPPSQPTPQSPVAKGARIEPPKIAPPPPPAKKPKREAAVTVSPVVVPVGEPEEDAPVSPTVIARPAPPARGQANGARGFFARQHHRPKRRPEADASRGAQASEGRLLGRPDAHEDAAAQTRPPEGRKARRAEQRARPPPPEDGAAPLRQQELHRQLRHARHQRAGAHARHGRRAGVGVYQRQDRLPGGEDEVPSDGPQRNAFQDLRTPSVPPPLRPRHKSVLSMAVERVLRLGKALMRRRRAQAVRGLVGRASTSEGVRRAHPLTSRPVPLDFPARPELADVAHCTS